MVALSARRRACGSRAKPEKTIYAKNGTLEDWKTNVAEPCMGNAFLMFAVSSEFAGPLLELYDIPGGWISLFWRLDLRQDDRTCRSRFSLGTTVIQALMEKHS